MFGYTSRQLIGTAIISSLLLMENIDAHILNVAIPQMAIFFNTSVFILKLAVTSYLIGLAIFIPISGWVADKIGVRNTLLMSNALFLLMSFQCALTNSIVMLIVCRLLQGIAGAFMVPVARILLLRIFSKAELVKAYTIMGIPVMIGPVLAPILGGYLVTYFSWRYIFWVNIPIGLIIFYATWKNIENYKNEQTGFNLKSFIFLSLSLGAFCFWLDICLLDEVSLTMKLLLILVAGVFGVIYYLVETKSTNPLICYALFRLRTFRLSFLSTCIIRAALGGRAFIIAIFLEISYHLSAFEAGLYFIWMAFGVLISRGAIKTSIDRFGFKATLTVANICGSLFLLLFIFVHELNWFLYVILFFNGVFAAAQFMSINILYYAEVDEKRYASAVSIAATLQQLGSSFGVVIAASILHVGNLVTKENFNLNVLHYTFIGLALVNILAQIFVSKLEATDGNNLRAKHIS
ncbi:MAG: MFS transporter [Burkholderiales bacterium]|nr:MFS transporter [Burkholderiales bacterium]